MKFISKSDFQKLKPVCLNNEGNFGSCFLYNNQVLKVFKISFIDSDKFYDIVNNVNNNLNVEINGFAFPKEILNVEGYNFAYLMPKVNGNSFYDIINLVKSNEINFSFFDLVMLYQNGVDKIFELNNQNIKAYDMNYQNCKVNNNELNFYDTDFYIKEKENIPKYINLNELNNCFSNLLIYIWENLDESIQEFVPTAFDLIYKYNHKYTDYDILNRPHFIDYALEEVYSKTRIDTVNGLIYKGC